MDEINHDKFIATYSGYDKAPIFKEILFDKETPISLASRFLSSEYHILLESIEGGEKWARYSFFAHDPVCVIKVKDHRISIIKNGQETSFHSKDPVLYLDNMISSVRYPEIDDIPRFCGGFAGFFAYDAVRYSEKIPDNNKDDIDSPDILLMQFDQIYAFDHLKNSLTIIVNADMNKADLYKELDEAYMRLGAMISSLKTGINVSQTVKYVSEIKALDTQEGYMDKVRKAKEYIHEGDIFQVVLSMRSVIKSDLDSFDIYRMLRTINPSPYMFEVKMKELSIAGASPEMIVRITKDIVQTCPIAGTRKRGANKQEDELRQLELQNDEKETAEHMMLVDLGRNDIGKISKPGTVLVENLMHIEKFSHVMHMVTNLKAELGDGISAVDALMSFLPAGTLSGAPKIRAMEIIDELEEYKRGIYGGALGYFSYNRNADFCIIIRTAVKKGDHIYLQAGAGIVADSDPEKEYEECSNKAKVMIEAIKKAGDHYDTVNR